MSSTTRPLLRSVGMVNVDYFQTAFKRYYDMTPRTYRLNAKDV